MKRALLTFFLVVIFCSSCVPVKYTSILRLSIVNTNGEEEAVCTVWSIGPRKFLTAAHCILNNDVYVIDGREAIPIKIDKKKDMAILLADVVREALPIRDGTLTKGEIVHGVGYAEGLNEPVITDQKTSVLRIEIGDGPFGNVFVGPFIQGMSGGPIVDEFGNVVGMVQATTPQLGFGVDSPTIEQFIK